ncbi:alpha-actinin [Ophidiomyces ophidiicola]|nr:alpha-actinin [Ophidiomyces ophidiicola]
MAGFLHLPTSKSASGAKLRINNLHYDITEGDLEDLFTRIGPIISLSLLYDRAGRSEGVAYVIYKRTVDAQTAIREFDGANAKGQPIRVTLVQTTSERSSRRNPFDFVEKPKGSLFDRAERPRDTRSLSPVADNDVAGGRGRHRRSDVSRPPPDNIDRYVPGQRSPRRDGGRSRARRPENRERNDSHRGRNGTGRPRKTQEELDQEMADYWAKSSGDAMNGHSNAADATQPAAPAEGDDIDMIQ